MAANFASWATCAHLAMGWKDGKCWEVNSLEKTVARGCTMSRFMFIESNVEKTWMHNVRILESNVIQGVVVLYSQNLKLHCLVSIWRHKVHSAHV